MNSRRATSICVPAPPSIDKAIEYVPLMVSIPVRLNVAHRKFVLKVAKGPVVTWPIDVPAGFHRMTLNAAGFEAAERSLNVESGSTGFVSVDLIPSSLDDERPSAPGLAPAPRRG